MLCQPTTQHRRGDRGNIGDRQRHAAVSPHRSFRRDVYHHRPIHVIDQRIQRIAQRHQQNDFGRRAHKGDQDEAGGGQQQGDCRKQVARQPQVAKAFQQRIGDAAAEQHGEAGTAPRDHRHVPQRMQIVVKSILQVFGAPGHQYKGDVKE